LAHSAVIEENPATVAGVTEASEPPASIISQTPDCIFLKDSPIAFVPEAQADTTERFTPFASNLIATRPDAIFDIIIGIKKGDTLLGPFV